MPQPPHKPQPKSPVRRDLERLLSKAGICSRTAARGLIRAGQVRVDGKAVRDPRARFPASARITLDHAPAAGRARVYLALHKPRGYVTTRCDPAGRRTVYDLLPAADGYVAPVGRLDRDSSGLLLLTNDSVLADRVTSPGSHLPKTYRVEAAPRLDGPALERLRRGPELADGPTRPALVRELGFHGPCSVLEVTITEGRNRQVRRMVRAVGSRVRRLVRIAIGPLQLGDLPSGAWRALEPAEVRALQGKPGR